MTKSAEFTNTLLTERDRSVLDHVARHRITTHQVLHRLFFAELSVTASVKVASRLCRAGMLQRIPLLHRRCYFALTPAAARVLGVSQKRTGPLGVQALPVEFATLHFACLTDPKRRRLTPADLAAAFPWMQPAWTRAPHCVVQSEPDAQCLELIRVVHRSQADHVARKCQVDIRRRRDNDGFQELLRNGRFRLVVIVATRENAAAIRTALDAHVWPDGLVIHLAVLSQLAPLLGGTSSAS